METILVKVSEPEKANLLVEMLKSLDFASSVDYVDELKRVRHLFEEVN